jgi:hypothetical protein
MRLGFYKVRTLEEMTHLHKITEEYSERFNEIPNSLGWGIGLYQTPHYDDPIALSCMFFLHRAIALAFRP